MEVLLDLFNTLFETMSSLGRLPMALGTAFTVSLVCLAICNLYSLLWNKAFYPTLLHRLLSLVAAVISFLFIFLFIAFANLKEIALMQTEAWSKSLESDSSWEMKVSRNVCVKIKEAGLEDCAVPASVNEGPVIMVTKNETQPFIADFFLRQAGSNFKIKNPFLAKLLWPNAGITSNLIEEDIRNVLGDVSEENKIRVVTDNDEFVKRIQRENAKTGDIQLTLIWNNKNDLDLHTINPNGEWIYFKNRKPSPDRELDVDKNRQMNPEELAEVVDDPVENIYYLNSPEAGTYEVRVNYFIGNIETDGPTPFKLRVKTNEEVKDLNGEVSPTNRDFYHKFTYEPPVAVSVKQYRPADGVRLATKLIKENIDRQAPRLVTIARTSLLALFFVVQGIPFFLIGYAAYKNLKERTA